ncbi:hypothetical protein GPM19_08460 [Halomonas sp. ZH2S]|uniref:Uncharacterized protein n=1 Tax=Vreelandella zhuhanensis TaxID=2684210 RepID=A0A7X3H251_9GAMM|nr:hypothetical protein [Halomonas zhuhanensis]MWJ28238.1 hypothetical protein [Halomonas zhuhanensis]
MNLHRAYLLFAAIYSLLIIVGVVALLLGGGNLFSLMQLGIGMLAVLGLWGYSLGKSVMNQRTWRPLALVLAIGSLGQLLMAITLSLSPTQLTWMLAGAIFFMPLAVILYQYGDRDQALWATPEERDDANHLKVLLDTQPELVVEKQEADRRARVRIAKLKDGYRANVNRRLAGTEEQFEERFSCLSTLVFFVEKFTCLTTLDIQKAYAHLPSKTHSNVER